MGVGYAEYRSPKSLEIWQDLSPWPSASRPPQNAPGAWGGGSSEKSLRWTQTCPSPCWSKSNFVISLFLWPVLAPICPKHCLCVFGFTPMPKNPEIKQNQIEAYKDTEEMCQVPWIGFLPGGLWEGAEVAPSKLPFFKSHGSICILPWSPERYITGASPLKENMH